MTTQTLKGFRDFLPKDALKRQWLKDQLIRIFEVWGFDPLETPTLEPLELFAGNIGEDEQYFYNFTDRGGRQVALRYDQTVPACRVVGQYARELPMPFRRYQIQPAFRAENTQRGRYREFTQCDADIFGTTSPLADAEVIGLSLDIYRRLGFPQAKVLINDRSLLADLPYAAIVAIDKLAKIGEAGVIADMVGKGISESDAKNYLAKTTQIQPNTTLNIIFDYLKVAGFNPDWFAFSPTLARAFSYSTGPIWEVIIPGSEGGSVLGGERYDKLVEKISGQSIPGTGFGLGFDRTLEAAQGAGLVPDFTTKTKILVTVFSPELKDKSIELSTKLRQAGYPTELYPDAQTKLEKQLKYAAAKSIPHVAIIGPEEVAQNQVKLKTLSTGTQTLVSPNDIQSSLS